MKKASCLLLVFLLLFSLLAACGEKTPAASDPASPGSSQPSASDPGSSQTPSADPGTSEPATPAEPAEPAYAPPQGTIEPSKDGYNQFCIFGDGLFSAHNMGDILGAFAAADGYSIKSGSAVISNLGKTSTYGLYELCTYSDLEATSIKNVNSPFFAPIMKGEADYIIIPTPRDRVLSKPDIAEKEMSALELIQDTILEHCPDATIIFVIPPAYKTGAPSFDIASWMLSDVASTYEEHKALIEKAAQDFIAAAKCKYIVADLSSAFDYYFTKYDGPDLYDDTSLRHPSPAGAYYEAAVLYGQIFGKSTVGMDVYGFLDEDLAKDLQLAAHKCVFGTENIPTSHEDIAPVWITADDMPKDPRFENEEYPAGFEYLYATLNAYRDRGVLVQYDQLSGERVTFSFSRRTVGNGAPEQASPQNPLYLDCSSLAYSSYEDTFGYTFNGLHRSKTLALNATEAVVFNYCKKRTTETPEEAAKRFIETIRPGDVISYSDDENTVGHTMLYVGNGTIIHCAGYHVSAANSDYQYSELFDNREMSPGAILVDNIDLLLAKDSPRYLFSNEITTQLIRPLSLGLTPTENAVNRLKNLDDIVVYKETTAYTGVTVNPGDDITVTITVKNIGKESKSVQITETLPAGLSYKNGSPETTLTVAPGETKTISYVVTVSTSAKTGIIKYSDTYAGGVRLGDTPVYVANTLKADEQAKIFEAAKAATAKDSFELIKNVYAAALNKTVDLGTPEAFIAKYIDTSANYFTFMEESNPWLAANLFGGESFVSPFIDPIRVKSLSWKNFIAGDILFCSKDGTEDTFTAWLYAGNGTFMTVKDGQLKVIDNCSDSMLMLDTLFGQKYFVTYRPSQLF